MKNLKKKFLSIIALASVAVGGHLIFQNLSENYTHDQAKALQGRLELYNTEARDAYQTMLKTNGVAFSCGVGLATALWLTASVLASQFKAEKPATELEVIGEELKNDLDEFRFWKQLRQPTVTPADTVKEKQLVE